MSCSLVARKIGKRRVFVVLHDPGGAHAVAPVVGKLAETFQVSVFVHSISRSQIDCDCSVCDSVSEGDAQATLGRLCPNLVLTGTSYGNGTIDKRFTRAAKKLGVPTLAVLDYWANYRERFTSNTDGRGEFVYLPDRIAVMDDIARGDMLSLGFPPERLVVTGNPAHDRPFSIRAAPSEGARRRLSASMGIEFGGVWVLFLSQPIADIYGEDDSCPLFLGYTEKHVSGALAKALSERSVRALGDVTLMVRYHPRESLRKLERWPRIGPTPVLADGEKLEDLLLASDLVVGMTTAPMIDAYIMGKPVVSVQLNQRREDDFILTRQGLVPLVTEASNLAERMVEEIRAGRSLAPPPPAFADGLAAARVAKLAGTLVNPKRINLP